MCIVLISTAHPSYSLILINNRDEFLARPTALAAFWPPPYSHVLGGRDLLRSTQGTWLGITVDGRIAVLTNFREEDSQAASGQISRGEMINAYLKPPTEDIPDVETFVNTLISGEGARGAGGFSLVCGRIGKELAVVSNRTSDVGAVKWISLKAETVGLSNAAFGDRTWDKVVNGEKWMKETIRQSVTENMEEEELIQKLFKLLSIDTLPPRQKDEDWELYVRQLRDSIFIPVIGDRYALQEYNSDITGDEHPHLNVPAEETISGAYGTQKQTVVLVNHHGNVTFVERSLFGGNETHGKGPANTLRFEFKIKN